MAISAGYLNKRISFLTPFFDTNGEEDLPTTPTHRCWANVKYQRGSQIFKLGDLMLCNTIVITTRAHSWLSARDKIMYQDNLYRITSMNIDDLEDSCTIVAEKVEQ